MANFSKRSLDNLVGVHPLLVEFHKEAIKDTPIDYTIVEGVRTDERQKQLYAQGRTVKGSIVTYADGVNKKSNHQPKSDGYGHATDCYPFVNGKLYVTEKETITYLKQLTDHFKKVAKRLNIPMKFGIDWKKPFDPPHIELDI